MELLEVLWIGLSIAIWAFVGFSLKMQYRYATRLADMLPAYVFLPIAAEFAFLVGTISWLLQLQFVVTLVIILSSIFVTCMLIIKANEWYSDYRTSNLERFLDGIKTDQFSIRSFEDYTSGTLDDTRVNVIIRHDVDISLDRTKKIAEMENTLGISSTFFFRLHAERYSFEEAIPVIRKLADDGFRIGLHYETLGVTKGNLEEAVELLETEIEEIRKVVTVSVVAAHGQKQFKNRTIWEYVDKAKIRVSSAYDMKYDMYLSDAGGKSLRDKTGKYLFERVYEAKPGQVVQVLIHPDWWY